MSVAIPPPESVRGMKMLDRERFKLTVSIPAIRLRPQLVSKYLKKLQDKLLRQPGMKHVQNCSEEDKLLLLIPSFAGGAPLSAGLAEEVASDGGLVIDHQLMLEYHHWSMPLILKAVLPVDTKEIPSSFETVGHIAHLNLSSELAEYKHLIGQVLLDNNPQIRTVVNKTNNIDETFRFFKMEVLAGDDDLMATMRENGCQFTFDYSKVYWNSRLATEHRALVDLFHHGDIILDVFAGVGPFSLPAAKKGCFVHANDLNPAAFHSLANNAEINKLSIQCYNMDGREFIRKMATDIMSNPSKPVHVIMNLPASAVEFLDVFHSLNIQSRPTIHCYHFSKAEDAKKDTVDVVNKILGVTLADGLFTIHQVRDVAPKKLMVRISFELPLLILSQQQQQKQIVGPTDDTPAIKRSRLDQS